jgi:tetratricopeptide (TPR) repeat protein
LGSPWQPVLAAEAPTDDFARHLTAAVRFYEDLEYEQALEQLQRARRLARGIEQDVSVALHEGLILADLGRWEEARAAFRTALLLKPGATLPLRVSPKVVRSFEEQRVRIREELARQQRQRPPVSKLLPTALEEPQPPGNPSAPVATDRPEQPPVQEPVLVPPAAPEPVLSPQVQARSPRPPLVPLVLLGTGGLVGSTGAYFGWLSRRQVDEAWRAQYQDELISHREQAQRSARTANILLGTAGIALAGAVVSWLLYEEDAAPESGGGR